MIPLMADSEEELKSLLMKVKEDSEKAGLKLNIQKAKIMASNPIILWQMDREAMKQWQILFSWAPKSLQMVTAAMKLKDACSLEDDKPRQCIKKKKKKKERCYFADKDLSSQSCGFSSSHVLLWELDHKEGWVSKNWCFWTMVLEKILESLLDCKEIKPVHPKGNQSWIFIGKTDAEAETPIFWPPDAKSWLIRENPDAGKDWGQEEKGMTEDEMAGWHHQLNGHGFEWTLGVGDGQGSVVLWFMGSQSQTRLSDWTELNWT